jgi:hypothetical protein
MRLRRDLLVALMGFGVVFALVYVTGRALLPSSDLAELVAQSADTEHVLLDDLRADLSALGRSAAVIEVSGAVAGRSVLDNANVPYVFERLGAEADPYGPGMPIDLDVRYSSRGVTLAMIIPQVEPGVVRIEGMTIVFTVEGRSFNARAGDCMVELTRSGYLLGETASSFVLAWPYFAGQVTCEEVRELRSDDTVSFTAVFHYDPDGF